MKTSSRIGAVIMLKYFSLCVALVWLSGLPIKAQEPAGSPAQATQRITGAISAVDRSAHTVTVKEDKTGTVYVIELQNTKSVRKVDPSTLDLKTATRITADDLMAGDRVQVFAMKAEDNSAALAARSVILISARDLQTVHQEQAAAWQRSTAGVVTQVDAGAGTLSISARTPQGPKPMSVEAAKAEFTRYSSESPRTPLASKLSDVQIGDQVRVIGEASADGSTLTAKRVYSSPIRVLVGTVSTVAADGKGITLKDLQTKQPVILSLNDDSVVRRIPQMTARGLARKLNPALTEGGAGDHAAATDGAAGRPPAANSPATSAYGAKQGGASPGLNGADRSGPTGSATGGAELPAGGAAGPGGGGFRAAGGGMRNGDMSQFLDRLPKINATDLKPGDAVVVSGAPIANDKSHLLATNVIAGVEPIFQSASPRQMQSLGDWGLTSGAGGIDGMSQQ